jgi:type II secretion system protein D
VAICAGSIVGSSLPALAQTSGPQAAETYLNAYAVPAAASAQAQQWASRFAGQPGQRVAFDARTNQLLVMGDAPLHKFVAEMLQKAPQPGPVGGVGAPASPDSAILPLPSTTATSGGQIALTNLTGADLHARLERVLAKPLPLARDTAGNSRFVAELSPGNGVTIDLLADGRQVRVSGPQAQISAWNRVISALDAGAARQGDQVTSLVATKNAPQPTLQQTLSLLGDARSTGQFTMVVQQPEMPAAAGGAPNAADAIAGGDNDTSLVGPVQIEFVEGLDMIIVRGSQRDVEKVMQIIGKIEDVSAVTIPAIEILPLQHVESRAMAALVERVYAQVLGARTGTVSITPLVKPNALLLIGRTENVKTAVDLVQRIDQPVEPATRFEVFQLQHASAAEAKTLIDEFLENTEGQQEDDADVLSTLKPRGLVVADARTNTLVVSASPRDLVEIARIVKSIDVERAGAIDEVRVFKLRNTLAEDLAETLRNAITGGDDATGDAATARQAALTLVGIDPENARTVESGVLNNVKIAVDARANSLVITAPSRSMELIAALIEQLDRVSDAKAELKVFTIANGDAVSLQEMLQNLFGTEEQTEAGSIGAGENPLIRLQLSVDQRTNSIIAAGTRADLSVVEAILQTLDTTDIRERRTQVYRLKNAFSVDVATSLNEWLATEREAEANAELVQSSFEQFSREVIIVPDQATNSLIVSATPDYYEKIRELIEQLDARPPMVNIQVLIAEVRLNDTDEFGVELGLQDSLLFDRSILAPTANSPFQTIQTTTTTQNAGGATIATQNTETIINAPISPGFNFGNPDQPLGNNGSSQALATAGKVAAQGLSSFGVSRVNSDLGFGGFVFSASSNSVSMLLRALQENRRLEVLSRPQIVALDNQPGEIRVGQRVPRISAVNTTNFGQNNTVEYEDAGIILQVTPRINDDGLVVMTVYAEKSQVGSTAEGIPIFAGTDGTVVNAPRIDQTVAQTTVAAMSGQTVVLSGLLTKQTTDVHRRVPLLSEIPLLGDLFRYDFVSEQRTELLIILTPRVMRNELDAEMIKQVESSRMSWVLCDVIDLHGPSGLKSRCDDWTAETEAIYPGMLPPGAELVEPAPVPAQPAVEGPVWQGTGVDQPSTTSPAFVTPTSYDAPLPALPSRPLPRRLPQPY